MQYDDTQSKRRGEITNGEDFTDGQTDRLLFMSFIYGLICNKLFDFDLDGDCNVFYHTSHRRQQYIFTVLSILVLKH